MGSPFCYLLIGLLLFGLCIEGAAKPVELFRGKGLDGFTLQPPVNALGPIAANGTWSAEGNAAVAAGTAAPWTVQTAGSPGWTDYRLAATVTIRKPGPRANFPVTYYEYDRYMPREDYPPGDHAGQYRYRYFAGEFDWGSEAALYVRYQDRQHCYRVQFSTEYQEIILWHGLDGYLQVAPWTLKPGTAYRVEVLAQGAHIQVRVDGKTAIDYWHECLPTLRGGIGLGAYRGTAAFGDVAVTALPPAGAQPPHAARFHTRLWRGLRWIFDGNEPIALLYKAFGTDDYHGKSLYYHFVKLRPGYRPLYLDWLAVRRGYDKITQLIGEVGDIKTTGEKSARLTLDFDSITSDKLMRAHHTDVLTYDAARGVYRHDVTAQLAFDGDQTAQLLEFSDPLTYNNKPPGSGVKYPWLYAGHDWGLATGEDGKLVKHVISEGLYLEKQDGWPTEANPSLWVLYPDRAVCPAWETDVPGVRMYREICHWGYDYHQRIWWRDQKPRAFKAGDRFTIKYVMTGYPPEEAERLSATATPAPQHVNAEPAGKIANLLQVPSAYAFAVCDPGGTSFAEAQSVRQPFAGWPFFGDYTLDREVGRTDHYSLRLDGPATASGEFYHHMIDSYGKQYVCTLWIKTRGVTGRAPTVSLKYSYKPEPCDRFDTGLFGDNDWQELTFLTTVPVPAFNTYDSSTLVVTHSGMGSVWIDDFSVRPVAEGETIVEKRPASAAPAPLPGPASADYLIYLKADEGRGASLADASGHGNGGKVFGAAWAPFGGRSVLRFDGKGIGLIGTLSPELQQAPPGEYPQPALTLEAWVRPAAGMTTGAIIGYMTSPLLALEAVGKDAYRVRFMLNAGGKNAVFTTKPLIKIGQWSHVAVTLDAGGAVRLYVNGTEEATGTAASALGYTAYWRMVSIGMYGKQYGYPYFGDLAELRWWSRAATAAEMAAAAQNQPE